MCRLAALLLTCLAASAEPEFRDAVCEDDEPASMLQVGGAKGTHGDGATQRRHLAAECPPAGFDSVEPFNVSDYISAPWYIQMQAETSYQKKDALYCVRANYTETSPGLLSPSKLELIVDNYAKRSSVSGPDVDPFLLRASVKDLGQPSKLVVGPPFVPVFLRGPYWVVAVSEPPYQWAIVSGGPPTKKGKDGCVNPAAGPFNLNGNGEGLWLFTREPVASNATIQMLVGKAQELGFDTSVLLPVQQQGCCGQRYGVAC